MIHFKFSVDPKKAEVKVTVANEFQEKKKTYVEICQMLDVNMETLVCIVIWI